MDAETEDLVSVGVRRDLGFVLGARPAKLVHELRRQTCGGGTYTEHCDDPKKPGIPNAKDFVMTAIFQKHDDVGHGTRITRQAKKAKEENHRADAVKVGPLALF